VRVIDEHEEWPRPRQVDRQPVQPVQDRERRLGAGVILGRDEHRLRQRCRTHQQDAPLRLVGADQHRLEQLADDSERQLTLQLAAARAHHAKLAGGCPSCTQEAGLADPRRTLHHQPAALSAQRRSEQSLKRGELALPVDERTVSSRHGAIVLTAKARTKRIGGLSMRLSGRRRQWPGSLKARTSRRARTASPSSWAA
jgi:hypothetical protein